VNGQPRVAAPSQGAIVDIFRVPPWATFNVAAGMEQVQKEIVALLPGDPA